MTLPVLPSWYFWRQHRPQPSHRDSHCRRVICARDSVFQKRWGNGRFFLDYSPIAFESFLNFLPARYRSPLGSSDQGRQRKAGSSVLRFQAVRSKVTAMLAGHRGLFFAGFAHQFQGSGRTGGDTQPAAQCSADDPAEHGYPPWTTHPSGSGWTQTPQPEHASVSSCTEKAAAISSAGLE